MQRGTAVDSYVTKLIDVHYIGADEVKLMNGSVMPHAALLLVMEGSCSWVVNGITFVAGKGMGLLLDKGDDVHTTIPLKEGLQVCRIRFHLIEFLEGGTIRTGQLAGPATMRIPDFSQVMDTAARVQKHQSHPQPLERMKANIVFQDLFWNIIYHMDENESTSNVQESIALTLEYMELRYYEDISREQLAGMAGMSVNYYSRIFKHITGKSPIEYLSDIRMKHGKQLLLFSDYPLQKIARTIGYQDEFYFSRKFKKVVGFPPTVYARRKQDTRHIVSLSTAYTGNLIALGVEPYAALVYPNHHLAKHLQNAIILGASEPDFTLLKGQEVDLILCFECEEPRQLEELNRIAPTFSIPFHPMSWREHLRTIAGIIGKEAEADEWLRRYDAKAKNARQRMARKIGKESVVIVALGQNELAVYGNRNMGAVLYGDLLLTPAAGVGEIHHFKVIAEQELWKYDADHMIVICDSPEAFEQLSGFFHEKHWSGLTSVRKKQVYYADSYIWGSYNALSHDLILDETLRIFEIQ